MHALVLTVHVLAGLFIIGLVLLQQGKGAEMGASLGAGVSQSVFGSQGSGGFLFRCTAIAAAAFMMTSLTLGHMATNQHNALKALMTPVQPNNKLVVPLGSPTKQDSAQ